LVQKTSDDPKAFSQIVIQVYGYTGMQMTRELKTATPSKFSGYKFSILFGLKNPAIH